MRGLPPCCQTRATRAGAPGQLIDTDPCPLASAEQYDCQHSRRDSNADCDPSKARRFSVAAHSCALDVFRQHAHADGPSRDTLKSRDVKHRFELPRRTCRPGILKYPLKQVVREDLHLLGYDGRKFAPPLDQRECRFAHAAFAQWLSQQVRRRHRILNRQIDANSARR